MRHISTRTSVLCGGQHGGRRDATKKASRTEARGLFVQAWATWELPTAVESMAVVAVVSPSVMTMAQGGGRHGSADNGATQKRTAIAIAVAVARVAIIIVSTVVGRTIVPGAVVSGPAVGHPAGPIAIPVIGAVTGRPVLASAIASVGTLGETRHGHGGANQER